MFGWQRVSISLEHIYRNIYPKKNRTIYTDTVRPIPMLILNIPPIIQRYKALHTKCIYSYILQINLLSEIFMDRALAEAVLYVFRKWVSLFYVGGIH